MLEPLAAATVLAALALPSTAQAVDRPPMKSCGDLAAPGGGDELFKTIRFDFGS